LISKLWHYAIGSKYDLIVERYRDIRKDYNTIARGTASCNQWQVGKLLNQAVGLKKRAHRLLNKSNQNLTNGNFWCFGDRLKNFKSIDDYMRKILLKISYLRAIVSKRLDVLTNRGW
jgi:hypothetical protein